MNSVAAVMKNQTTVDLNRARRALNSELEAYMMTGRPGTQAHVGMLEMVQAIADELDARGIGPDGMARDGSDLPRLVHHEGELRLSVAVLCF